MWSPVSLESAGPKHRPVAYLWVEIQGTEIDAADLPKPVQTAEGMETVAEGGTANTLPVSRPRRPTRTKPRAVRKHPEMEGRNNVCAADFEALRAVLHAQRGGPPILPVCVRRDGGHGWAEYRVSSQDAVFGAAV